jgi:signal transduction histidine kinase
MSVPEAAEAACPDVRNSGVVASSGDRRGPGGSRSKTRRRLFESPALMLTLILASAFVAEAVIMIILSQIPLRPRIVQSILDASLLAAFLYPCLYYFIYRPLIRHIADRKRVEAELRKSQEQLRNYSSFLWRMREEDRTRVAREIHDQVGQGLTALKMDLAWLARRLDDGPGPVREKVATMGGDIDGIIRSVKEIWAELRPGILDELGLGAAVEWQAREFERSTGIRCRVLIEPEDLRLDRERSTSLFRIFQETLMNVARHAKATEVEVLLQERPEDLVLEVQDNGSGITQEQADDPRSTGLVGIRERVQAWGGEVEIGGSPGRGTRIRVTVPLKGEGEAP